MKLVIDIDKTIWESTRLDSGIYTVQSPNNEMIEKINLAYDKGHEIILNTARHWNLLSLTIKQLKLYNVKYTTLTMGKPVGDYYVGDKEMTPEQFLNEVTL